MEDLQIIGLFFERSEEAIAKLDVKYGSLCRQLSYNIVNNAQDAEECVNDAYLGAWQTIPPTRPDPLRAYVCKIVRNVSLKLFYRKDAAKRCSRFEVAMEELEHSLASRHTVESEWEAKELTRLLEQFLDTLSAENRVIFLRRYWFADNYAAIGARLNMNEKLVSVRLTRMRKQLKRFLNENGVFV